MELLAPYMAALLLGSVHALEADHMAAVTAFTVRRPAPLEAVRFGVQWAVGHGASVLVVGGLLLLVGLSLPESLNGVLERGVGLVLVLLGFWTMRTAGRLPAHAHRPADGGAHVHLHPLAGDIEHRHAPTMIGAVHGLAGAAPAL